MKDWIYIDGYRGKKIVNPDTVDLTTLKTNEEIITAYCELCKASHHRSNEKLGTVAWEKEVQIVDEVRELLEKAGWHAHIFKGGSTDCGCDQALYLHSGFGTIEVHQVPFSSECNIDILPKELFNADGSLRSMKETIELLRKRIGDDTVNLDADVSSKTADIIRAIMKEEDLNEVHEVDESVPIFRSGAQEYTWRDNEEEAEQEARELLEDGDEWKMAVKEGNTDLGLTEWIAEVLESDGWETVLCAYDGTANTLEDGTVYWRTN
jgi:hypothetical protein